MMRPDPRVVLKYKLEKHKRAKDIRHETECLRREKEYLEWKEKQQLKEALMKYREVEECYIKQIIKKTKIKKSKSFHDAYVQTQKPVINKTNKQVQAEIKIENSQIEPTQPISTEVSARNPNLCLPVMHKKSKSGVMLVHFVGHSPKHKRKKILNDESLMSDLSQIRGSASLSRVEEKPNNSYDFSIGDTLVKDNAVQKLNPFFHSFRDVEIPKIKKKDDWKLARMKDYYNLRVKSDFEPVVSAKNKINIELRNHKLEKPKSIEIERVKLIDLI
ncbi:unnamed protein product [Blepharisma stoltei]|uniref:Uncharacterized protein n=1 Tax=Blepharisma stoltei TaxID=1481888 RepID=A0AAU9K4J0_9CILI|nr:unnamed protein product [Blepharisma stoltei]